jgi:hypothetical protein
MIVCLVLMAASHQVTAQEDEKTSVHITITEDGKVTTDTTFELKEGQDPEMVRKMVEHMAGGEAMKMKKKVIISQGDDEHGHQSLAWVHVDSDDEDVWHINSDGFAVNLDSIKEAHGGGKLMVFKDEDGNLTVKELGEDEDHEIHRKHEDHGDQEIMIIESEEGGEKIHIKKIKKGDGHVMILSDDDDDVYVIRKGDKDVRVVKKVRVEIDDESDEAVEKEVEVEVKKEKKKKKEK